MNAIRPVEKSNIQDLLANFSAEVTTPDRKALDNAARQLTAGTAVYIASLPKDSAAKQLEVARQVRQYGLEPIPHIVARNIVDRTALETQIRDLAEKAGVNRALILGGDRAQPLGEYDCALQLIQSGVLEANGISKIALGCYPEGHPQIDNAQLETALLHKLEAAEKAGLKTRLISQLCFDASIILTFVESLRQKGIHAPLRIGVAGPAKTATLLKYAAICGVGPSIKALRQGNPISSKLLSGYSPRALLQDIVSRLEEYRQFNILGIHFFTFSALSQTLNWLSQQQSEAYANPKQND